MRIKMTLRQTGRSMPTQQHEFRREDGGQFQEVASIDGGGARLNFASRLFSLTACLGAHLAVSANGAGAVLPSHVRVGFDAVSGVLASDFADNAQVAMSCRLMERV